MIARHEPRSVALGRQGERQAAQSRCDRDRTARRALLRRRVVTDLAGRRDSGLAMATSVTVGLALLAWASPAHAQVEVTPTAEGFPGGAMVQTMINWVGQFGLWGSVASLLMGAGIWGVSQQFGNGLQAGKGKILAAAGAIGAVLTGLAPVIVNTLYAAARA